MLLVKLNHHQIFYQWNLTSWRLLPVKFTTITYSTSKTYHCRIRYQENLSQFYLFLIELTSVVFVTSKSYRHRILPIKLIVVLVTDSTYHRSIFTNKTSICIFNSESYHRRTCHQYNLPVSCLYRGADKSLARPGRKHARKHVRGARDFNNIVARAVKFFPPARQGAEGNSRHS